MMHPDVEEAIDLVDATVFSGDTFFDQTNRQRLRDTMARWERGLASFDEMGVQNGDED